MRYLSLYGNNLIGSIPPSLMNASRNSSQWFMQWSKSLYLSDNKLHGHMPTILSNCSQLQLLSLSYNEFDGHIHSEIGRLSNLQSLHLGYNHFTGEIPKQMRNLVDLEILSLAYNSFSGSLEMETFNISGLRVVSLFNNNLSGTLPSNIGSILPNIEELYLDSLTNLVGTIPHSISNCSKLTILDLSGNKLSGLIPSSLGYLTHLQYLNVEENNLTSDSSLSLLTSLTNNKNLTFLDISFNPLNCMLPAAMGNLSTSLRNFYAKNCKIIGRIPNEVGNLSSLLDLDFSGNNMVGSIPTSIGNLRDLQRFNLSSNKFTGFIGDHLCKLQHLGAIYLGQNQFSGSLPYCLGNITSLREIHLGSNKLSSNIPASLGNLQDLVVIDLSSNNMVGSLPQEIGNLKAVTKMDLSMNQFSNEIPREIGGLQTLAYLSLRHNKLQGAIPDSMSNMVGLEFLDLSHNNISGIIPMSFEKLQYLKYFDVSDNQLYGEIPSGGPFKNLSSQFFIYNEALCGSSRFSVLPCPTSSKHRSNRKILLVLFLLLAIVVVFVPLTIVLLWIRYRRGKSAPQQVDSLSTVARERISYYELLRATNVLSESNLIGSGSCGSVYKGVLSSGTVIAVKVFNLQLDVAFKNFDTECEVFRSLRHRNLVKVITSCSNLDFKAFVLEYMPNGSLEKYLYSHNYFLDIRQRLSIMIDVACALEYLHHRCSSPVIHSDLKPGNVLLNEDMVAHLRDFGISKLLGEDQGDLYTKTLARLGYIAPGEIPKEISNLVELEELDLADNSFSGQLDTEIFNISGLRIIDLSSNSLSGSLPSNIDSILPNVEHLYLDSLTNLVGTIPLSISNCSKLTILDHAGNKLTGLIPNSLGYLTHLQLLNLEENNLTSDSSLSFLNYLANSRNLTFLDISLNPLNGMLPASMGNLSTSLRNFFANSCKIKGRISNEVGNLSNLLFLDFSGNNLVGSIPTSIGNLRNLQHFDLTNNKLTRFIGDHIWNLTSLREINLGSNKLSSNIPPSLGNLQDLVVLDLSSNNMVGSLPQEIRNIKAVTKMDLSKNQFSNEIPREIGGLQNLAHLSLRHNKLQGSIPDAMSNMNWVQSNRMSLMMMQHSIPESLRGGITENTDAKGFLKEIADRFATNEKVETSTILNKIVSMRYKGKGNIREYIMEMCNLVTKLRAFKLELSDDILVHLVFISLPTQFSQFKVSYNTQKEKWNLNELIAQCVQEEDRLKQEKIESAHLASNSKTKTASNKRK
ncbi:hypothetical protein P3S67_013665 [Capsicum chacoense]